MPDACLVLTYLIATVNIAHYNLPIKYLKNLIVDQMMSVNYWLRRYKDKAGRSSSIFTLIQ